MESRQALCIISLLIGALGTFAIIIFAFHIKETQYGLKLSNYIYLCAAWLTVISTVVVIAKTRSMDAEKDRQLKVFETRAAVQIQQFKTIAAQAAQEAQDAKLKSEETSKANYLLRIQLQKGEAAAKKATAELTAQTQRTYQFAQGLAEQQQSMAQEMQATPHLGDPQINAIASVGIKVKGIADPSIPQGQVGVYIGPE